MKNLCFLFGTEQYFKSLILTLDDRVDNGYVELTETSPCNAVSQIYVSDIGVSSFPFPIQHIYINIYI